MGHAAKGLFVTMLKPEETAQGKMALAFANALVAGDYRLAHSMLSDPLQTATSTAELEETFHKMIEYGDGPPSHVEVMSVLQEWPARQADDVGWAYVSIRGESYAEAVTVVVAQEQGRGVIRDIEWGRP